MAKGKTVYLLFRNKCKKYFGCKSVSFYYLFKQADYHGNLNHFSTQYGGENVSEDMIS